jgi:deoxyribonuclease-4
MLNVGLKLWSINNNYIAQAERLYKEGLYQYIELYAVPGSYKEHISFWENLAVPFIVHAPHIAHGMNLAKKENMKVNLALADESKKYADGLGSDTIIIHSGVNGETVETARQLVIINDGRFVIENTPYYGLIENTICNGNSIEEIAFITRETGSKFCFDVGHGICSANAKKIDPIDYIKRFMDLKPHMYHLSDGSYGSVYDRHDNFGKGDYPLKKIVKMLPPECSITVETEKESQEHLDDYAVDVHYLKNLFDEK